ncbi:MAG: hypothetical protein BWK76_13085 [Desulfobulbaceae bacterium A2]|nr:MAG: hypothetical protein BWK76_13085 [Desulfobulbaceae bacterium A2]
MRQYEGNVRAAQDRDSWLELVRQSRQLYLKNPKDEQAPAALLLMGQIHRGMFGRFRQTVDLDESQGYFLDVARVFPKHALADDALYTAAEIASERGDYARAAELLTRIVQQHAHGDRVGQATVLLKKICVDHNIPLPEQLRDPTPSGQLATVLPVKYWSSNDYTRIVIRASQQVKFSSQLLEEVDDQPRRLYLDFNNSFIDPKYRTPIPIEDGLLKRVRTGQFNPSTVRVVLDIESISDYKIFNLKDPFRVVVDVQGKAKMKLVESKGKPEADSRVVGVPPPVVDTPPLVDGRPPAVPLEAGPIDRPAVPDKTLPPLPPLDKIVASERSVPADKAVEPEKAVPAAPLVVELDDQKKRKPSEAGKAAETNKTAEVRKPPEPEPVPKVAAKLPSGKTSVQSNGGKKNGKAAAVKGSQNGITLAQQLGLGVRRIVIDPGHGGKDPGATAFGLQEKDIVLQVSKKLAEILRQRYGYEVSLTREDDSFHDLEERTAIANTRQADLFLSIHVNAHPSPKVRGIETFFLNLATNEEAMRVAARENATSSHNISDMQNILADLMKNSKIQESSRLAEFVQDNMVQGLRQAKYTTKSLGVKQAPFYVLLGAQMPAVLAEISFVSHPEEAELLRQDAYLERIAQQIAAGVAAYTQHATTAALR